MRALAINEGSELPRGAAESDALSHGPRVSGSSSAAAEGGVLGVRETITREISFASCVTTSVFRETTVRERVDVPDDRPASPQHGSESDQYV